MQCSLCTCVVELDGIIFDHYTQTTACSSLMPSLPWGQDMGEWRTSKPWSVSSLRSPTISRNCVKKNCYKICDISYEYNFLTRYLEHFQKVFFPTCVFNLILHGCAGTWFADTRREEGGIARPQCKKQGQYSRHLKTNAGVVKLGGILPGKWINFLSNNFYRHGRHHAERNNWIH